MTTDATLPLVGTIGLTTISGDVGKLIKFGQFLNGQGFKDWEHAFLLGPNGKTMNAEPGGARIGELAAGQKVYCCVNIAAQYSDTLLKAIWDSATEPGHYLGVGYSGLDYGALALHRFHINPPGLKDYIGDTGHLICSQLCDQAYADKGAHLFNGVWPGYVTPLGLYNLDRRIKITRSTSATQWRPLRRPRTVKM